MIVYISGPMTGVEDGNKAAFLKAWKKIHDKGDIPISPVDIGRRLESTITSRNPEWEEYMRADIKALMGCDAIMMLEGWRGSKGATIEKELADKLGIPEYRRGEYGN